jgi:hypothetical protein
MHCSVPGCNQPPVAKGYCARHYMRVRRQGDPDKVGKPGRPSIMPGVEIEHGVSRRSFTRVVKAMKIFHELGVPEDWINQTRQNQTRQTQRNSFNHSRALRIAERLLDEVVDYADRNNVPGDTPAEEIMPKDELHALLLRVVADMDAKAASFRQWLKDQDKDNG